MKFYIGLHQECDAWPFARCMISINRLVRRNRRSGFRVNDWILDSGAFSQISQHGGFVISGPAYAKLIERWSQCGNLEFAVVQDWMCEPEMCERTGKTVAEHQALTIESYRELKELTKVPILPVLQGYRVGDYLAHLEAYGELLEYGAQVGVGSVCKRNGQPNQIEDLLLAIKTSRPDLRLHGFGLKLSALESGTVRKLLYSSDSMAWCQTSWLEDGDSNDPREALRYAAKVESITAVPCLIQKQLFEWWR